MANLIFCKECGGLKCDESIGNYSWEGGFCHCAEDNQPNIDMGDYVYDPVAKIRWLKPKMATPSFKDNEQKMIEEYAEAAELNRALAEEHMEAFGEIVGPEIRFCPCCGAALGIL